MMNASVLTFVREECYYPVKKFLPGTYLCFGKIFLRFHASGLTQIIDHVYDISRVGSNRGRRLTVFFVFCLRLRLSFVLVSHHPYLSLIAMF